jgi:hypothetical protein
MSDVKIEPSAKKEDYYITISSKGYIPTYRKGQSIFQEPSYFFWFDKDREYNISLVFATEDANDLELVNIRPISTITLSVDEVNFHHKFFCHSEISGLNNGYVWQYTIMKDSYTVGQKDPPQGYLTFFKITKHLMIKNRNYDTFFQFQGPKRSYDQI